MRDGYGKFGVSHDDLRAAHRYGWELAHGPIPDELIVCHRCDTPLCQNPAHLFLGTSQANTRDMMSKGRARFGRGKGAARDANGRYTFQP